MCIRDSYGTDAEDEEETENNVETPSSAYNQLYEARSVRGSDSSQDSSSESAPSSRASSRRRRKQRRNDTEATDISEAVDAAFHRNMSSFRLDFEAELGSMNSEISTVKEEVKKLDNGVNNVSTNMVKSAYQQDEIMQEISNDIRKLSTVKNGNLADFDKIPQLVKDSSEYAAILSNVAACQKKQNSVIDTNSSSLIELKDQLKSTQAQNKANYDSALKIYNSTQAVRIEKLNSFEKGQAEVIELLSSLKK